MKKLTREQFEAWVSDIYYKIDCGRYKCERYSYIDDNSSEIKVVTITDIKMAKSISLRLDDWADNYYTDRYRYIRAFAKAYCMLTDVEIPFCECD